MLAKPARANVVEADQYQSVVEFGADLERAGKREAFQPRHDGIVGRRRQHQRYGVAHCQAEVHCKRRTHHEPAARCR